VFCGDIRDGVEDTLRCPMTSVWFASELDGRVDFVIKDAR